MRQSSSILRLAVRRVARLCAPGDFAADGFEAFARRIVAPLLVDLDWVAPDALVADPTTYRRCVLHADARERFTVACLVWAPGQRTPIHDHRAWGVVGVARGALRSETFLRGADGALRRRRDDETLGPGDVTVVDPRDAARADIHRMGSASAETTVSVHIYGCPLPQVNRCLYEDVEPRLEAPTGRAVAPVLAAEIRAATRSFDG